MLRIRNMDGSLTELPQGAFVEMVNDASGFLGSVWYQRGSKVTRITPETAEAWRYEQLFKGIHFGPLETKIRL